MSFVPPPPPSSRTEQREASRPNFARPEMAGTMPTQPASLLTTPGRRIQFSDGVHSSQLEAPILPAVLLLMQPLRLRNVP